ncbi:uromodulin-like [Osmerus eperlanus]|uniref:uromodulin-like n=1 Tax=Osmerus eperlanus TaxID=29151 RepID=UPI002E11E84B
MLCTMMTSSEALLLLLLVSTTSGKTTENMDDSDSTCDSCQSNELCIRNTQEQTWQCGRYAPELVCGRSYLEVGLLNSQLLSNGLDPSSAHLADPRCSAHQERDGRAWYQVERREGSCGNTLTANTTHAIYSNTLFLYAVGQNRVSTPIDVPFSCVYPMNTHASIDLAVVPRMPMNGIGIVAVGPKARASMSLFPNSSYTAPYPAGPVTLPLGSVLHVGVSVEETEIGRFVVVLEDCYATHSPDPNDLLKYLLIQHKCPTDRHQVTVEESGLSLQARFSALLFLFQGDYRDVYLHCSLNLCDQRNSSCSPVCSRRTARSVSESLHLKPLTIGPITCEYGVQPRLLICQS